jgi:hypothetical protein
MTEPTEQEMHRALAALAPFVRRWRISLNPEDLHELAYAILRHARSNDDLNTITTAVNQQIDHHDANAQRLRATMQADLERRHDRRDGDGG